PAPRAIKVPWPATRQMHIERMRQVLLQNPHVGEAAIYSVGQRKINQAVSTQKRYGRLSAGRRKCPETAAFTARQHKSEYAMAVNTCLHPRTILLPPAYFCPPLNIAPYHGLLPRRHCCRAFESGATS